MLSFTPTALLFALTYATHNDFKYYDPNTWNTSLPENILQYLDFLDTIKLSAIFRNTSVLNDQQCNTDLLSIPHDLRENNQWPKVMLDAGNSIQHGLLKGNRYAFGNYDECLSVKPPNRNFTGKYCLVYLTDTIMNPFDRGAKGIYAQRRPLYLLGICIPSTCSSQYLNSVINEIRIPFSNATFSDDFKVGVDNDDCHTLNQSQDFTTLNWITIAVLILLAACLVSSTLYGVLKKDKPFKLCLAFSIEKNLPHIFDTRHSSKFSALTGIKGIAAVMVVLGHCFTTESRGNIQNWDFSRTVTYGHRHEALFLHQSYTAVNTFLFSSGTLIVFSFLNEVKKRSQYDPGASFIKRYLRLMTPVAFLLLVLIGISDLWYIGPFSKSTNKFFRKGCKGNIWWLFMFCSNFLETNSQLCVQHVWYVVVDLQLTLATQLLFIYALWNPKKIAHICAILCWGFAVLQFVIAYTYNMSATPTMDMNGFIFQLDYSMPHTRSVPWLGGMFFGFLLHNYIRHPLKLSKVQKTIAWFICAACIFVNTYPIVYFNAYDYQQPWAAIFHSFHSVAWSLGLGILCILCLNGYGGYISDLLAWGPLKFYDNIGYELYLVHIPCLEFIMASSKDTMYFSYARSWYLYFTVLSFSTVTAIVLVLTVTAPCNIIIRELLPHLKIIPIKKQNDNNAKVEALA